MRKLIYNSKLTKYLKWYMIITGSKHSNHIIQRFLNLLGRYNFSGICENDFARAKQSISPIICIALVSNIARSPPFYYQILIFFYLDSFFIATSSPFYYQRLTFLYLDPLPIAASFYFPHNTKNGKSIVFSPFWAFLFLSLNCLIAVNLTFKDCSSFCLLINWLCLSISSCFRPTHY